MKAITGLKAQYTRTGCGYEEGEDLRQTNRIWWLPQLMPRGLLGQQQSWTESPLCGGVGGRALGSCYTPLRPLTYMHHMTLHGLLPYIVNCVTRSDRQHQHPLLVDRQEHQPYCKWVVVPEGIWQATELSNDRK